jgi:hypothetical protein
LKSTVPDAPSLKRIAITAFASGMISVILIVLSCKFRFLDFVRVLMIHDPVPIIHEGGFVLLRPPDYFALQFRWERPPVRCGRVDRKLSLIVAMLSVKKYGGKWSSKYM